MPINGFLYPGASGPPSAYEVANSLRFNDGSSEQLSIVTSAGSDYKATFSAWVKKTTVGVESFLLYGYYNSNNKHVLNFYQDQIYINLIVGASTAATVVTNRVFRDPSAWYHIVVAWDTTQGTASDRIKVYVNGVQETSFGTANYPNQNTNIQFNRNTNGNYVGGQAGSNTFDGYMSEVVYIDGSALDPTSFGEFDSDSPNIWKPIDVSGLTFGTNGFYLEFKQSGTSQNSSGLGADTSGNDNHLAVHNLTATDQTTDTCTNNFATINALDNYWAGATLEEGNTKVTTGSSNEAMSTSTFAMTQGKWYMEVDNISGAGAQICGITPTPSFQTSSHGKSGDVTPHTVSYIQSGKVQEGNGSGGQTDLATYSSYGNGNIIGIYMDLDNMKAYFSKDGSLQSSTGIDLEPLASNGTGHYMFFAGDNNAGSRVFEANFGNGFQSLANAAVTDDNGYGAFEYSPNITGDGSAKSFYSCCTKNLSEFG